jgi:hypothetical protein
MYIRPQNTFCLGLLLTSFSRTKNLIFKMSTAELAVSYAALILADDNVDITVRTPSFRDPGSKKDVEFGQDADCMTRPTSSRP